MSIYKDSDFPKWLSFESIVNGLWFRKSKLRSDYLDYEMAQKALSYDLQNLKGKSLKQYLESHRDNCDWIIESDRNYVAWRGMFLEGIKDITIYTCDGCKLADYQKRTIRDFFIESDKTFLGVRSIVDSISTDLDFLDKVPILSPRQLVWLKTKIEGLEGLSKSDWNKIALDFGYPENDSIYSNYASKNDDLFKSTQKNPYNSLMKEANELKAYLERNSYTDEMLERWYVNVYMEIEKFENIKLKYRY